MSRIALGSFVALLRVQGFSKALEILRLHKNYSTARTINIHLPRKCSSPVLATPIFSEAVGGDLNAGLSAIHPVAGCLIGLSKALASYVGLIPAERSSGRRQRLGRITKQGNPLLRFLWTEAGVHVVRRDPEWEIGLSGTPTRRSFVFQDQDRIRKVEGDRFEGTQNIQSHYTIGSHECKVPDDC